MKAGLVLASGSPRRKTLLKTLGIPFQVIPSGLAEPPPGLLDPIRYTRKLALAKAQLVAKRLGSDPLLKKPLPGRTGPTWVLGADTAVVHQGEILGKPVDFSDACRMLERLQGTTHRVITAVALVNAATFKARLAHAVSSVTIRRLTSQEIARYSKKHLDKAGAYAVQEKRDPIVTQIKGSYTNVVGLPMELVKKLLGTGSFSRRS